MVRMAELPWALLGVILVTLCTPTTCKVVSGEFKLTGKDFHYLTRFGCSIGICPYNFRFKLISPWSSAKGVPDMLHARDRLHAAKPSALQLQLILDEEWERSPVNYRPTCATMHTARIDHTVQIPLDGEWSHWMHGTVHQVVRPHIWYFLADDCRGVLTENIANELGVPVHDMKPLVLRWEAEIVQPSGSHFSYELLGTFPVSIFHIFCYAGILCFVAIREIREMKRFGRVHVMLQMLNVCILTQLSSSLLHFCHLLAYAYNGHGLPMFDLAAEALAAISQIVLSSVLIFIAFGYSLNIPTPKQTLEISAIPIVAVVTALHVCLVVVDKYNADPRFKSHAAEGAVGVTFTVLRLLLWLGFVIRCWITANAPTTPSAVAYFVRRFTYAGSLYFLAYPAVFGATTVFAPYLQHKVLTTGIFLMQAGSMLWLTNMFLRRGGQFFKVSEFGSSYLPGGYLSSRGAHRIE